MSGASSDASTSAPASAAAGPPPADTVELEVESIAVGGDGVAREPGGRVVFIPRTAPGDRVEARIVAEKRSFARALPLRILRPGPDRRDPPCPYYVACGGCQLQHLTPEAQRAAKRGALADALQRIGGLKLELPETESVSAEAAPGDARSDVAPVEVPLPEAPGPEFGYRNRITLTLRRGAEGVVAGYHRYDYPARLLDVGDCPLGEEPVREAWRSLRAAWGDGAGALPSGEELRITVRATAEGDVALLVAGGSRTSPEDDPSRIMEGVPGIVSYQWLPERGKPRTLAGAERFEDRWEETTFRLRPNVFLQPNRRTATALDAWLRARVDEDGGLAGRRVLDLYAGVGARAIRWAEAGAEVVACEVDEEAVRSGREAVRSGRPASPPSGAEPVERHALACELMAERVEDVLHGLLPADLVIVNPPRRGLGRKVAEVLADAGLEARAARLAYVSCDPATLARDLKRLGSGWRIHALQPFDAFPNTAQVETAVWLEAVGADAAVPAGRAMETAAPEALGPEALGPRHGLDPAAPGGTRP